MEQAVLFDVENGVALITLNRPERRNAINQALLKQLYDCIDRARNDSGIKAVIITGSGKAFCAGLDLDCFATENLFDPRGDGSDLPDVFAACHKPIIGAVNGYAITGGFELALNCDFLIASEAASFADTHAKIGVHPGWGMTQLLQQAIGQRRAKQYSLSCQFMPAQLAFEYGLVNEVVAPDALISRAREIAAQIGEVNFDMMITIKKLIETRNSTTSSDALATERQGFKALASQFFKS